MKTPTALEKLNMGQVHLVGIGGAGQHPLAEILLDMGYRLSGSDLKLSATTEALVGRGVRIYEGHRAENLAGATLVVATAAASATNPELVEAARLGLTVLTNAQMVGRLFNEQHSLLAVAGTHGKTTTTGLVAYLLQSVGFEPSYYIGGVPRDLGSAGHAGPLGNIAVVEADEYARRFLNYKPYSALVTNIEADHLDYYGTFEALQEAFGAFAANIKAHSEAGLLVCADDAGAAALGRQVQGNAAFPVYTYGLEGSADWRATNLEMNAKGGYDFDFSFRGKTLGRVEPGLPGLHNVRNATGALALAIRGGASLLKAQELCAAVGEYQGVARRFEVKGEADGITVVDDYAHHPTEIKATLAAARARYGSRRLVALFQPHTYSRTKALLDEFAGSFKEADLVALLEIFPSRETDTLGVSSQDVLDRIKEPSKLAQPLSGAEAAARLTDILRPGDVLLTLGAGDVWKIGEEFLAMKKFSELNAKASRD